MNMKKSFALFAAAATLTLVSGCGGDDPDTDATTNPPANEQTTDDDGAGEPEAGGVLTAMVGTEEDPDAFVITLMDESGAEVTDIPAGDYTIEVNDPSTIHNFHLMGGSVDESTTVPEQTETTWTVTLEAGDYDFRCDPHPNMVGSFTVS